METTLNIASIIIIVFGILQIILFFKIWGMTNDVSEMKSIMKGSFKNQNRQDYERNPESNKEHPSNSKFESDIKIDDLVIELKSERQLKVTDITSDGRYKCRIAGGVSSAGIFDRSEIELFDKYWNKTK